eukprot:CAMPEP_0172470520 /NCGR_PEP_ID=MMETSP1065-20121228/66568_1 /TAXON_ID=265537 /ORGANISM="Amphiprora paludosa, Strain CCMP125" /LENGTH=131 /DNA_ID=CAMNT_0013228487 /DNA_START=307 /DNA_END=702 /DNA_ORIENTATION=-
MGICVICLRLDLSVNNPGGFSINTAMYGAGSFFGASAGTCDVVVTGSNGGPTGTGPPDVVEGQWIVCGRTGAGFCSANHDAYATANKGELHEVRCCSDTSKNNWQKWSSCDVWTESDLPTCQSSKTLAEAR